MKNIPDDGILLSHHRENFKSYTDFEDPCHKDFYTSRIGNFLENRLKGGSLFADLKGQLPIYNRCDS
jgi:hypothetical protein